PAVQELGECLLDGLHVDAAGNLVQLRGEVVRCLLVRHERLRAVLALPGDVCARVPARHVPAVLQLADRALTSGHHSSRCSRNVIVTLPAGSITSPIGATTECMRLALFFALDTYKVVALKSKCCCVSPHGYRERNRNHNRN